MFASGLFQVEVWGKPWVGSSDRLILRTSAQRVLTEELAMTDWSGRVYHLISLLVAMWDAQCLRTWGEHFMAPPPEAQDSWWLAICICIHATHEKLFSWGSRSRSSIMNRVLVPTMMHMWCEYGECSLKHFRLITLTRCYDLEGQGHDLEDESQGDL